MTIIVKLAGGLGNQMFQYAMGRQMAWERNILLKLDLSWFETQTLRRYMLDHFQITAEIAALEEVAKLTKSTWNRRLRRIHQEIQQRLPYYYRLVVHEKTFTFDPDIIKKVRRNVLLVGYWQSEKYFKSIDPLIRQEFQLRAPISVENKPWVEQANQPFAVSVHIRRADYINPIFHAVHGVCSPDYYRQAAAIVRERVPQAFFVIFSDDLLWARQNMGFLSPACFVEAVGPRKDEEELMLMSLCRHHIIANSSFSWWAAWLDANPEKMVIAPKKWSNDASLDPKELIPDTWRLI